MTRNGKRLAVLIPSLIAFAGAGVAAGCGAAGIGLGSLGVFLAGALVWAALAGGLGSGCYASHPDEDVAGEATACLAPPRDGDTDESTREDVGPCLDPPYDAGPCLGAPLDAEVCLTIDAGPCLSAPADATDALPVCPPEYCDICLNAPIDWCILECPPPDAGKSAAIDPVDPSRRRLAAAGVLSPDQLARLRRLQGRG